ncbi:MAG TPA: hypothetical protein VFX59_10295 [Polyangiales bacterium]|nr:hypothetical protein [Polyangiales bacterium]
MARSCLTAVVCIAAVACSDDGDKGRDTLPDGATNPGTDSGQSGSLDSGLDSSFVARDANVLPDGSVIEPPPDSGNPVGPDASAPLPCGGSCNDNVDCTIDSCINDKCEHRVDDDVCAAGSSCSLTAGCQQGKACGTQGECADTEACTVNERCNTQLARCEYDVLDRDGDGYPPVACGGTDCDDDRGVVNPSATETCNNRDDDCDGAIDDNLAPVAGYVCTAGAVQCAQGYERCGGPNGFCVDQQTDNNNCGGCGQFCDTGESCVNGACTCAATSTMCSGQIDSCSDTTKSEAHCGACGNSCAAGQGGVFEACISGACAACGSENEPCCDNGGFTIIPTCAQGLTCEGGAGAVGSKCTCAAGSTKCGDACVDLKTSNANCGECGNACEGGESCLSADGVASCQACGGAGEACCTTINPLLRCRGGRTCGPDNTCVIGNASGPGGGGPGGGNGPG